MKLRLLLKGPIKPEFITCGLGLNRIQFAMFNVVGGGSVTRRQAVLNWIVQFYELWRKK